LKAGHEDQRLAVAFFYNEHATSFAEVYRS
jgi:hypothetical protein